MIVLATGRYLQFVPGLVNSAVGNIKGLTSVFVLSDRKPEVDSDIPVHWLPWGHTPWPYSTMLRYRAISTYSAVVASCEVLLHIDADMVISGEVDISEQRGLFAVQHVLCEQRSVEDYPFERRPQSRAFVPAGVGSCYVFGAVQGGESGLYLRACREIADWIQDDIEHGIVPIWHDESMWNRFCIENPMVEVLPSVYCTPDTRLTDETLIVALTKDHDHYRGTPVVRRVFNSAKRKISGWR